MSSLIDADRKVVAETYGENNTFYKPVLLAFAIFRFQVSMNVLMCI